LRSYNFIIYRIISTKHSVFSNMIFTGADPGFPVREGAFKKIAPIKNKFTLPRQIRQVIKAKAGADPAGGAPHPSPPKLGKITFFGVKS
jgi:hypothetical protein